jgi:hypothetical protein
MLKDAGFAAAERTRSKRIDFAITLSCFGRPAPEWYAEIIGRQRQLPTCQHLVNE